MFLQVLIFAALAVIIGLAFNLLGYRFFRVLLPIWAFFAGLMFGLSSFDAFAGGGFLGTSVGLVVGFVVGIGFAMLAYFFYALAVVLFGATLGYALGYGLMLLIGFNEGFLAWMVGIVVAVAFILLFTKYRVPRLFIVVATAFGGSMAIITGLFVLFGQLPPSTISMDLARVLVGNSLFWTIAWFVLGLIGVGVQYETEKQVDMMTAYDWEPILEGKDPETESKPKSKK